MVTDSQCKKDNTADLLGNLSVERDVKFVECQLEDQGIYNNSLKMIRRVRTESSNTKT